MNQIRASRVTFSKIKISQNDRTAFLSQGVFRDRADTIFNTFRVKNIRIAVHLKQYHDPIPGIIIILNNDDPIPGLRAVPRSNKIFGKFYFPGLGTYGGGFAAALSAGFCIFGKRKGRLTLSFLTRSTL